MGIEAIQCARTGYVGGAMPESYKVTKTWCLVSRAGKIDGHSAHWSVSDLAARLVRRLATHNRYFSDIQQITAAIERTLSKWHFGNDTLRPVCAIT